ncbi:MAG: aspartate aminotransferase family protein [Thermoplasmata archaeon]|nr:aspartate aminotransferase family protein [Thermoplasmata archaeon]
MGSRKKRVGELRDYEASTRKSKRIYDSAKDLLPRGVESNFRIVDPYPFYISRGEGSRIWDVDGNEYLDFLMSQGVLLLGHNNPVIKKAIAEQIEKGMTFALPTEIVAKAARLVNEMMPSMQMMRFANSGTEATMHAIRVARGFTGKDKIAKSEGGYHGVHDQVLWSFWGPEEQLGDRSEPKACIFSKGIPKAYSDLLVPIIYNDLEGTERILRKNADSLAALIIEPVLGSAGCLLPRNNYLNEVAKICKENDILLILDEVVTGFRLGPGGAQKMFGIKPDMTCLGKALGGGMPVAAFGGRREIMETLIPNQETWPMSVFHGGTYNAHPAGMAATIAALKIYKQGRFYPKMNRLADELFNGLGDITTDMGMKSQVRHIGSMGFVYFNDKEVKDVRDTQTADWQFVFNWAFEGVKRGVLFGHPKGEKLFLSAAHSKEDIDLALEVAKDCFKSLTK